MLSRTFALLVFVATALAQTNCPATPSTSNYNNANLPDPFTFADGVTKVVTKADWACRRAEISKLVQANELGALPTTANVSATLSGSNLAITVTDQGKSISFTPTIRLPSGTGPFPAIIAYGFPSIPIPANVALITYNNDDIAAQNGGGSRGQGKFYTLYGSGHDAGATLAWAWGVGRIVDAIEKLPSSNIDPKRIGVTGCSRNGKGAFIAGAFEPRLALTIPQESGSGGTNSWRVSDWLKSQGQDTQTASQIIGENPWFGRPFDNFARSGVSKLPFDHHLIAALVAPRGFFAIDQAAIAWLGAQSSYIDLRAARQVWTALGAPEAMGFSQSPGHDHCSFPSSQQASLTAFINKFLLNQSTNTANITDTAGNWASSFPGNWATWQTPTLT